MERMKAARKKFFSGLVCVKNLAMSYAFSRSFASSAEIVRVNMPLPFA